MIKTLKNKCSFLFIVLAMVGLFVTGCMRHSLNIQDVSGSFSGLESDLIANNKNLNILIIHGMSSTNREYADAIIANIGRKVGLGDQCNRKTYIPINNRPNRSGVTIYEYSRGQKVVRFFSVWWSGINAWPKLFLQGSDQNKSRLPIMDQVKMSLLNDGVADVILYHNPDYRNEIQHVVEQGICRMTRSNPYLNEDKECQFSSDSELIADHTEIQSISISLGSKILFDALNKLSTEASTSKQAANIFKSSSTKVYMIANQLRLLELATVEPLFIKAEKPRLLSHSLDSFVRSRNKLIEQKGVAKELEIVAFSDPNDLLSYQVPQIKGSKVVNVMMSIAKVGYSLPFGKPKVSNPIKAHTGYLDDENVMKMIVNGYP